MQDIQPLWLELNSILKALICYLKNFKKSHQNFNLISLQMSNLFNDFHLEQIANYNFNYLDDKAKHLTYFKQQISNFNNIIKRIIMP